MEFRIICQHFYCLYVFGVYNGKVGFLGHEQNGLMDL